MAILDLLKLLVEKKGSDLHLIAGLKPAICIDGKLVPLPATEPLTPDSSQELIFAILALKYALRQDPDVILIGEMRDYETIGIAITSAETGHLVLGTLHTSSAAQTVGRIIDVFPAEQQPQVRTQLGSNLVGVISQVLLPRSDQEGRIVACELMIANTAIKNNVRAGKPEALNQIIQTSAAEGMQSLDQSLVKLCQEGKIEVEYAFPYVHDKATFHTLNRVQEHPRRPATGDAGTRSYLG